VSATAERLYDGHPVDDLFKSPNQQGVRALSSDANSHWLNADKPHYVKLEYRILQQIGARNSALWQPRRRGPPPLVAELLG
jgi:hypothetical protein